MDSFPNTLQLFKAANSSSEMAGNFSFILEKEGQLWFLEKGSVNLFLITMKEGAPEGRRALLANIEAPAILFNIHSIEQDQQIFAITEGSCILYQLPESAFSSKILENEDLHREFSFLLSRWINLFSAYFDREIKEGARIEIFEPKTLSLLHGQAVAVERSPIPSEKHRIAWLEVLEGRFDLFGVSNLSLLPGKGFFPLTHNVWLECVDAGSVKTHAMHTVVQSGLWQKGLHCFHESFLQYFSLNQKKTEREESSRIEEKKEGEQESLNRALQEMGALLNPFESLMISSSREPLFRACQCLGDFLKIEFILPQELPEADFLGVQLAAICDASGIRQRQVLLTAGWWKEDCGALLGFYGPENRPVAMINKSPTQYEMIDPVTQERKKVDGKLAKELFRVAYTFYRPFPENLKSGKEVFHFFLKNHYKEFIPLILYGVIASLVTLFPSIATGLLFNDIVPNADKSLLVQMGLGLLLAAVSTALFSFFNALISVRIQGLGTNDIQTALWDRLLKLPVSFFRKYPTGNLILRVMSTDQIRNLLTNKASKALLTGLFSVFFLIAMAFFSMRLTLVSLVLIALNVCITYLCARINVRLERSILEIQGKINSIVIQIIAGVGKLRVAGAENNAFSYWAALFTKFKKVDLHSKYLQTIVTVTNALFPSLSLFFLFYLVLSMQSFLSVGAFLAFYAAFVPFSMAIFDLSNTSMLLTSVLPLWERSKVIIEEEQEVLVRKNKPGILKGEISIDDVVFSYDANGPIVLNQLTLHINPREFVAIVGPSGCGKSTLVRLLLSFEKPQSGAIYFDEKDLHSLNVDEVRKQIGVVLQEGGIVFGSMYDNIVCGGIYSREQVEKALELSGFQKDMDSFPMGLHTVLPMGGETLSGGQKQRLLIARALLLNPKILILDEATSALDNRTQDEISHNIDQLEVTRIVIAHRLSTIKNADRIYVMEKGRVVQSGAFNELAAIPGPFANMLQRQKL